MKTGKALVVGLAVNLAMVGIASAAVTFDPATGTGFIGRGDVIDHPDLGTEALVPVPTITFTNTGHYEQTCVKTMNGVDVAQVFRRGDVDIGYVAATLDQQTPGTDNISGYLLTGIIESDTPAPPPLAICPGNDSEWSAQDDVSLVTNGNGQLFFDDNLGHNGVWVAPTDPPWIPAAIQE